LTRPLNLLLFTPADRLAGERIRIGGSRLRHLLEVQGAQAGDTLRVGEVGGLTGRGEILAIGGESATLAVALDTPPPDKLPLTLVLALPRPKMLRRMLRAVAEFGVRELHLIHSYRVEKSYWQTPVLAPATIREFLLQGLGQARDTMPPEVLCHRRFRPFVEDVLPGLIAGRRALLAHPGDYPRCPFGVAGEALLVVGPEGGLIPYEVARLQEAGCETVSLGPRILRVEHALLSLLGKLS
jgi:RsmE family RNA methyltransferase